MSEKEYERLAALVRALPPMTDDEKLEQALSFAYGNLALTTNHKPTRAAFLKLALERGWDESRFIAWSKGCEWWTRCPPHTWVLDGHNAGDPICSQCLKREEEVT